MPDKMNIEILEDGTISVKTDKVSGTNHKSADEFMSDIEKLAGGTRETQKKRQTNVHATSKIHQNS